MNCCAENVVVAFLKRFGTDVVQRMLMQIYVELVTYARSFKKNLKNYIRHVGEYVLPPILMPVQIAAFQLCTYCPEARHHRLFSRD